MIIRKIMILILLPVTLCAASGCGFFSDDNSTFYTASNTAKPTTDHSIVDNNELDDNDVGNDVIDDNSDVEDLSKRVFTIDDFAFVEIGKTTLNEVHKRIGCYSTMYLSRGYGSDEIYPTADPYVCIEIVYFENDHVVHDVLIQKSDCPIEIELIPFSKDPLEEEYTSFVHETTNIIYS